MRKAVSIYLIENERTENCDGGRIVLPLLPPKTDDEPEFDCAMAEQIEGGEVLAAHGQILGGMDQIVGNEVARILRQFRSCNGLHQIEQELSGSEVGENAGGDFRQCKRAFECQADLEGDVYVVLVNQFFYSSHFSVMH